MVRDGPAKGGGDRLETAQKKGKEKLGCHEEASWQRNLRDKTGSGCSFALVIKNWTDGRARCCTAARWEGPGRRSPASQTGLVALIPSTVGLVPGNLFSCHLLHMVVLSLPPGQQPSKNPLVPIRA